MNFKLPLTFDDLAGKRFNLHTHTTRCNHATGTEREYVEKAIEAGFEVLGFSEHMPHVFEQGYASRIRMQMHQLDEYVNTIDNLKKEYAKDITLYCGLEAEYFPHTFERSMSEISKYPLDYMILGQHFIDDEIGYEHVGWTPQSEARLERYVNQILEGLSHDCFLYVAHPDVIRFEDDPAIYEKHMKRLIDELKRRHIPLELNLGGFSTNQHYPGNRFIEMGLKNGNDFIIGVDAHSPEALVDYENYQALQKLIQRGVV